MFGEITGLAEKLENSQEELRARLDRIIELLEAILSQQSAEQVGTPKRTRVA